MGKVTIIGAGFVGSTTAYAMLIQGVASEITLIDIRKEKAEGEVLDLEHGLIFTPETKLRYGDSYDLCEGADVIVITAGVAQKPGETRLDLVKRNAVIFKEMIPKIMEHAQNPIFVVVTNPVDIITYLTLKYSGLPRERVFGSGTSLDTARLRYYVGKQFNVDPHNVHAFILGEHGDSEFPVWSRATVAGLRMDELEGYRYGLLDTIAERTKKAAYEIISRKGATYYAIGLSVCNIVKSILRNEQELIPVSAYLDNYYDEGGLCLSVPCIIGRRGIQKKVQLPLDEKEQAALHRSAHILREIIEGL